MSHLETNSKPGVWISKFIYPVLVLVLVLAQSPTIATTPSIQSPFASIPELENLDLHNPGLKQLRNEISNHLQISRSRKLAGQAPPLRFWRYRAQKGDNFFKIMSRTGQNADTLASVNHLASVYDVRNNQVLLIPNYRGIYYQVDKNKTVAQICSQYSIPLDLVVRTNDVNPQSSGVRIFIPGATLLDKERKYFTGKAFIHPLPDARISSRYGNRLDPFTRKKTFHTGIDLAAPSGTKVRASSEGKVVFSGRSGNYGNLVIVKHSHGYHTYYGHLKKFNVRKGRRVKQGQTIGFVGSTGRSTGPHLHFELRKLGRTQPPQSVLRFH